MDCFLFPDLDTCSSPVSGCALLNPGWTHMTRRLEHDSVIILGRKNRTLIDDGGTPLEITPGRVVVLPAGQLHRGLERIAEPVSYYWIHIHHRSLPVKLGQEEADRILAQPRLASRRLSNAALFPQSFELPDREYVQHLFEEALAEFKREDFGDLRYQLLVKLLLVQLTREAMKIVRAKGRALAQGTNRGLLDRILWVMEDEMSNPDLSVKLIAARLGVNGDYLGRSFKKAMETPVGAYIVERRIALARTRLRESADPLETIALQCGFGSLRQFHHHFKEREGTSPGAWRRNCGSMGLVGL